MSPPAPPQARDSSVCGRDDSDGGAKLDGITQRGSSAVNLETICGLGEGRKRTASAAVRASC